MPTLLLVLLVGAFLVALFWPCKPLELPRPRRPRPWMVRRAELWRGESRGWLTEATGS